MTLELSAVELLRLSYLLEVAKKSTKLDEMTETANKIDLLIEEQLKTLYVNN